jgi:hypothetical protein
MNVFHRLLGPPNHLYNLYTATAFLFHMLFARYSQQPQGF